MPYRPEFAGHRSVPCDRDLCDPSLHPGPDKLPQPHLDLCVSQYFPRRTPTPGASAEPAPASLHAYGTGRRHHYRGSKKPADGTIQTATSTFNRPLVLPNPPTNCWLVLSGLGGGYTSGDPHGLQRRPQHHQLAGYRLPPRQVYRTSTIAAPGRHQAAGLHCHLSARRDGDPDSAGAKRSSLRRVVLQLRPQGPITAAGPNTCTVVLSTNKHFPSYFQQQHQQQLTNRRNHAVESRASARLFVGSSPPIPATPTPTTTRPPSPHPLAPRPTTSVSLA